MTTIKALMEELAFIATQMGMLQARKEKIEAQIMELSEAKVKKEYVAPTVSIIVEKEAETLPPPPEVIYVDMDEVDVNLAHLQNEQDKEIANEILDILGYVEWDDTVTDIAVRYATWTPKDGTPITLTAARSRDHIARYVVEAYDEDANLIGISRPFIIDILGSDIVRHLRQKKGFSTFEKGTYKPVPVYMQVC